MYIVAALAAAILWFAYGWPAGAIGLVLAAAMFIATLQQAFREADAQVQSLREAEDALTH